MRKIFRLKMVVLLILITACGDSKNNKDKPKTAEETTYEDVQVVGAMRDAMWKGELFSKIDLDTIANRKGLIGLGPETYLTGELLVMDGKSYLSKVESDSTMTVQETFDVSAPFFVYTHVTQWKEIIVPETVSDIAALEEFIDGQTKKMKRPFAFTVSGVVEEATLHIQNLPEGSQVSSPQEAHQGQVDYELENETVAIVGFFSTEHQAVFTHHDTYMHLHLITEDLTKMGHLDHASFGKLKLYLPVK